MVGLAIPDMSHYITSKMAIIGFMRGLVNDVANHGITANSVLPGLTNTLATASQPDGMKRATWEQQESQPHLIREYFKSVWGHNQSRTN